MKQLGHVTGFAQRYWIGRTGLMRISRQWYIWRSLMVSVATVLAIVLASSVGFFGLALLTFVRLLGRSCSQLVLTYT